MFLFLFFVNKPMTIFYYLLGIVFFIVCSYFDHSIGGPLVLIPFCYTPWYSLLMYRWYFFNDSNNETVLGLSIQNLRKPLDITLILTGIIMIASLIWMIGDQKHDNVFFAVVTSFLCGIIYITFYKIVEAKIVSSALLHTQEIKELRINEFYQEIRSLLIKKLISE